LTVSAIFSSGTFKEITGPLTLKWIEDIRSRGVHGDR
jgi:hypothetical protein